MNDPLIDKLKKYLSDQPRFAPILNKVPDEQKNCVRALMLMCIFHYEVAECDWYNELTKRPELMEQFLLFDYCLFKYYDYNTLTRTTDCLLKCQRCSLVADYTCILTHMAMTHNVHVGLKNCAYCETTSLSMHTIPEFKQCQEDYYKKNPSKRISSKTV